MTLLKIAIYLYTLSVIGLGMILRYVLLDDGFHPPPDWAFCGFVALFWPLFFLGAMFL